MTSLQSSIDLRNRRLALLTVRSTGFDPDTDRIIEIGAVIHARGKEPKTYHRLIFPGVPILPAATRDHGLTDADVASAPMFHEIADGFARFLGAADLAGFDIRRFALPMLWSEFHRCSIPFDCFQRSVIDLQDIYHHFEPRNLGMAIESYLGRPLMTNTNALVSAQASSDLLEAQLSRHADLPRTASGLAAYPGQSDPQGLFHISEGRQVFATGRYRGRTLVEVAALNPNYLRSLLGPSLEWGARFGIEKVLENLISFSDPSDNDFLSGNAGDSPKTTSQ
jgi:DNA polymerase-3 subunit epsilon